MAIVHQASTNNTVSSGTSMTVAFPATVNADDDLIISVVIDRDDATGSTCDNGFTRLEESFNDQGSSAVYAAVFHKIASGSESGNATITFGNAANDGATAIMERYSGSDGSTTPPSSIGNNVTDTTPNAPGDVLSADDFKILATCNYDSNGNRYSAVPSGYTLRQNLGNNGSGTGIASADIDQTGDASTTYGDETWTLTAGVNSVCISVALKEAAAGGAITKVVDETVNIDHGTLAFRGLTRLVAEAVNISEDSIRLTGLVRLVSETVNIAETVLDLRGLTRSVAETVNIQETVIDARGIIRLVAETVNVVETVINAKGLVRLISETVNIQESASSVTGMIKLVSETVNITESVIQIVSGLVPGAIVWTEFTILPKVQFILDYIGPKITGKFTINNGRESDI